MYSFQNINIFLVDMKPFIHTASLKQIIGINVSAEC